MLKKSVSLFALIVLLIVAFGSAISSANAAKPTPPPPTPTPGPATPIQVYGAWHCGNDACTLGDRPHGKLNSTRRITG